MSKDLSLVDITDNRSVPLGLFQAGEILLGRSQDAAVSLPSEAVSFEHGVLAHMRERWFFKDLASTNGSWLNGEAVVPERWKLVRQGDLLQVGDRVLRLEGTVQTVGLSGSALRERVLLVFRKDALIDELPLPDAGVALIIGGARGDLELARSESARSVLIFEVTAGGMTIRSESGLLIVMKNGSEALLPLSLTDRDEIEIEDYVIICQNSSVSRQPAHDDGAELSESRSKPNSAAPNLDSWEAVGGGTQGFGRSQEGRHRFGELAQSGWGVGQSEAEDDRNLTERYYGTRAGGAGRPLAHDVTAFLPPPPPILPSFPNTTEGRWVVVALLVILISGIALAALLLAS